MKVCMGMRLQGGCEKPSEINLEYMLGTDETRAL